MEERCDQLTGGWPWLLVRADGSDADGPNLSAYEAGARRTRDLFAHPFEASIQLAGLKSVLNSYADVDGVPVGISREVLTDLLRHTLGFEGFVSSDYTTVEHVVTRQRAASTPGQATRQAVTASLDVELPTQYGYGGVLADEVHNGNLDVRAVDACVRRVLQAKFQLGLFENPYPQEHIDVAVVAGEGRNLSRQPARRSALSATPLYPFGHGLTYTDFTLDGLASDAEVDTGGKARIAATVSNTGRVDGAAVVQLYVRVNTSGVTRRAQQLAGFCRIELAPAESRRMTFLVAAAQLGYTNAAHDSPIRGRRVPDDVAIIGMDHPPLSQLTIPPLTTVAFDRAAVAANTITPALIALGQTKPKAALGKVDFRLVPGGTT